MAHPESVLMDDNSCFACGVNNPVGLRMKFRIEPGSGIAVCETVIPDHFNGWKGAAHGGIITTLLDETMVYACTSTGWFTVTGTIEVKFHRPVPTGTPVTVTGRVLENRGRSIRTTGKLERGNEVLASAKGILIPVRREEDPMSAIRERLTR